MPNKKKLIASFSKLEKCKGCDKDLDKNSSDEILRLGLCPTCYSEYIDMKRYVDKYVDEFEIDKAFDTSVDGLLNDYITEKNFEKIFFSGHKEQIYQYIREMISPPSSPPRRKSPENSDGESDSSSSDSLHEEESVLKERIEHEQRERQKELFERLKRENAEKIASFLAKNEGFRKYCANHFDKGTTSQEKEYAENSMILYLFELYDKRWPKGQKFKNAGNPLQLKPGELTGKKYCCYEYYAEQGRKEGPFRFVVLIDTVTNQPMRIYFTSTHYDKFIELKICD